ncbi:MAG TPA: DUF6599 family protein [Candidatus Acidoferrales bacterium]|nr:DUF6599 family protein [Candidatus Acidoferrales bacterium]
MRRILLSCVTACVSLAGAYPAAAQRFLPPSVGSWSAGSAQSVTLDQAARADAPAIREFGFVGIERADYARGAGKFTVTLYRMTDPSGAYGAFTFLRPAGMATSTLAEHAAAASSRALVVVGNFLIDADGAAVGHSSKDIESLANALKPKADARPFPSIGVHLPTDGIVPGSERYIVGPVTLQAVLPVGSGDWIGFSDGAEAISARFRKTGQEVSLLIVEYPTQQIAARHFERAQPILHPADDASKSGNPIVAAERDDDLISIAFGKSSPAFADALLKKVVFGHEITWNEPSYKATDLTWPVYIVGAFTGAGIIMLFSIVSGIGFGIIRVVIKTVLPGKVFDRHGQIEVIQLGLSGKRINTKDFY